MSPLLLCLSHTDTQANKQPNNTNKQHTCACVQWFARELEEEVIVEACRAIAQELISLKTFIQRQTTAIVNHAISVSETVS